jgi:SsrA-binding protein
MTGKLLLKNKRATFEYEILKNYEAGVVLSGPEVKSLRNQSGSFVGSFVKLLSGEAFLLNAQITPYSFADNKDYDPKRTRKLLLSKKELQELEEITSQKGKTLVPLAFILKHNKIKLEFAVARGKKLHDKRADVKKRDLDRELARARKSY